MKFDQDKLNVNPLFALNDYMPEFGSESFFAGNAEEYVLQYLTDRDAIQAALPEPMFKVGEKPIVKVGFTWLNNSASLMVASTEFLQCLWPPDLTAKLITSMATLL